MASRTTISIELTTATSLSISNLAPSCSTGHLYVELLVLVKHGAADAAAAERFLHQAPPIRALATRPRLCFACAEDSHAKPSSSFSATSMMYSTATATPTWMPPTAACLNNPGKPRPCPVHHRTMGAAPMLSASASRAHCNLATDATSTQPRPFLHGTFLSDRKLLDPGLLPDVPELQKATLAP